jgi:hydroxymethylglutaryl-CoA lyase
MVARMGVETGIDLDRLLAARAVLARALPGEPLYGYLPGRRQAGCAA